MREAREAAKVSHSNVASVFHLGRSSQGYYYAIELGVQKTQIETSFCEAIRTAREQKSASLEQRAEEGSAVVRHEMVGWSREEDDLGAIALKPKSADARRTA